MDQEMGAPAEQPEVNSGPAPLSDILGRREPAAQATAAPEGQPEPQPAPPPEPEMGEQPKPEQPRDERGKFAPKQVAPPATREEEGRIAAVKAEREKRQALERELADLRARMAAPQAQPQVPQQPAAQPQVPLPDLMFQDPAAFVQTIEQRLEQRALETRLATSEAIARQNADYSDAEAALEAYARSSPQAAQEVAQALRTHPAPAMWAYQAGKQLLAQQRWQPIMQQHSDPEAFIAAEVERRMQERMQTAQPVSQTPAAPRLPTSLASARAAAPRTGPGWTGSTPLNAILGSRS